MKHRLLQIGSVVLFCCFLLFFSGRDFASQPAVPEGYLPISTRAELEAIRADGSYILMNDIDLAGSPWEPLCSEDEPFTGILDGNGYAVYGLFCRNPGGAAGVFSYLSGAEIRDLTVMGTLEGTFCGAIAGKVSGETLLSGCRFSGSLSSPFCAGGIVGQVCGNDVCFSECVCSGSVFLSNEESVTGSEAFSGGICGTVFGENAVFTGCAFSGVLTGLSGIARSGGICGSSRGSTVFFECRSEGICTVQTENEGVFGGICGDAAGNMLMSGCRFDGMWTLDSPGSRLTVGGIAGRLLSAHGSVRECRARGTVSVVGQSVQAGGILGSCTAEGGSVSIRLCENYTDLSGAGAASFGGICGEALAYEGEVVFSDLFGGGRIRNRSEISGDNVAFSGGIVGYLGGTGTATVARCVCLCSVEALYPLCTGVVVGACAPEGDTAKVDLVGCYAAEHDRYAERVGSELYFDRDAFPALDISVWAVSEGLPFPRLRTDDPPEFCTEDLNGNGITDRSDGIWIAEVLAGNAVVPESFRDRMDQDMDGMLTAADLMLFLREFGS